MTVTAVAASVTAAAAVLVVLTMAVRICVDEVMPHDQRPISVPAASVASSRRA